MIPDDDRLRIAFAGTPEFAVPTLQRLALTPHALCGVFTQPDRPAGRGRKLRESPVKTLARSLELPIYQPRTLRDPAPVAQLAGLRPDLLVVVAYGLLLPAQVLATPRLGCINVHASLLPRWRGAAPVQRALEAGDGQTGVSIMRMEAGLDTGPVYLMRAVPIGENDTGGSLHDRLSVLGAEVLLEALPAIAEGSLAPRPQDDALATYAHRLHKQEGEIDWGLSAEVIARRVRAFNPWPVCYTHLDEVRIRIWHAQPAAHTGPPDAAPGEVLRADERGIEVATGDGVLRVLQLQLPGKRTIDAATFVNARPLGAARFR